MVKNVKNAAVQKRCKSYSGKDKTTIQFQGCSYKCKKIEIGILFFMAQFWNFRLRMY